MSKVIDDNDCGLCGWGQSTKMCTSCEQKMEHAKNDNDDASCEIAAIEGSAELQVSAPVNITGDIASLVCEGDDMGGNDGQNDCVADADYDVSSLPDAVDALSEAIDKMLLDKMTKKKSLDNKLFQDPPPNEDCPICMLPMPYTDELCGVRYIYMPCCGKNLCYGCMEVSEEEMEEGNIKRWCLFCRVPLHGSDKEYIERLKKRTQVGDAEALYNLGTFYQRGELGLLPRDVKKALELYNQAADLGSVRAHFQLAKLLVEIHREEHEEKALFHTRLAAIGGHELARNDLGLLEIARDNTTLAMKHFIISARSGNDKALKNVGEGYRRGYVTKDDYAMTLRVYQASENAMKSEKREEGRAKYYKDCQKKKDLLDQIKEMISSVST